MRLYAHKMSTTSRPILMFCQEQDVKFELMVIDLASGEHKQENFRQINPNGMVPVLDDGGFVLTESSAILKYLAEKYASPTYPTELKSRARINEIMDWFNTQFYREIAYHVTYPQVFPNQARPTEVENRSIINWGLERLIPLLEVLDGGWHMLMADGPYLTGADITIADYLGVELLACGDLIGINWSRYEKIEGWLTTMQNRPAWADVHELIDGYAVSLAEKKFITIDSVWSMQQ